MGPETEIGRLPDLEKRKVLSLVAVDGVMQAQRWRPGPKFPPAISR